MSRSLENQISESAVPRLLFEEGRLLGSPELTRHSAFVQVTERAPCALLLYTSGTTGQPKGVPQLRAHPWVQDVAVVGVPDETWGERAVAVVVASQQGREAVKRALGAAGEELRSWLKQRVASYQVPKSVVWKTDLPRNAMGKVQKPELLRLLLRG